MTTVLIVSKYPLFGEGVGQLVQRANDLVVLGVESDLSNALQKTSEAEPDVLILDSSDPDCDPALVLAQLLHSEQRATVIGLNLSDNVACVCNIEHILVGDVSDLLDIIRPAVSALSSSVYQGRH